MKQKYKETNKLLKNQILQEMQRMRKIKRMQKL